MRIKKAVLLLIALMGLAAIALWLKRPPSPVKQEVALPLSSLLQEGKEIETLQSAFYSYPFPKEHGAHPKARMESWQLTGHLTTAQNRRFGFQWMLFRVRLPSAASQRASHWASHEVYRGFFALTDAAHERFYSFEQFSRAALGLSGAAAAPVRIWLGNWQLSVVQDGADPALFHLRAADRGIQLELALRNVKPMVRPLNAAGEEAAQRPFQLYSASRLKARGTLTIDSQPFKLEGTAWLDHAWGELPLPGGPVAMNRYLLQLDDGREIFLLRMHRRGGGGRPIHSGFIIDQDGQVKALGRDAFSMEAHRYWRSPKDDTRYPTHWQVNIPDQAIQLQIAPLSAAQEIDHSIRYWGGAVAIAGRADDKPLRGIGHMELRGYTMVNSTRAR